MDWARNLLFIGVVVGGLTTLAANLLPPSEPAPVSQYDAPSYREQDFRLTVVRADNAFRKDWDEKSLNHSELATNLIQIRRVALGLMGTIPSLEEIRQIEALPADQQMPWWIDHVLKDQRFHDYFGERLARAFVGTEDGPFLQYRRRRFVTWLSEQVARNKPYDGIVRELIAGDGLWTDHPATNFITVTVRPEMKNEPDPVRLAGRVTRAFLGIRLDCAQCHNHPFTEWKQADFHGLSAFFAQAHLGFRGIQDGDGAYEAEDRYTKTKSVIEPSVPFLKEHLPANGARRDRLAAWVTHPKNEFFARSTVNRVWAIMCGKPLVEPIDNLEPGVQIPVPLQILADDFAANGFNLHRLIRLIASSEAFRLDSASKYEVGEKEEKAWAVFPLTRLRPEQVAGSVLQAASISTINAETHITIRLLRQIERSNFVKRYGDTGEDEFEGRGGTIPQSLLRMNGELVRDRIGGSPVNASTRISLVAPNDPKAVEVAYLTILSRRPTPKETTYFEQFLNEPGLGRSDKLADIYWALINSTEFSWNH